MVPLYSQDLVCHLVELLHLAVTQQLAKVLDIFSFLERTSNREFLLFLFCVVAIVVPNRYVSPTLLQFLCLDSELISYCLFRDVFISRVSDRVIRLQHVVHRRLRANQTSNLTLCQLEVRTQTVINNLVSLVN
jgi:hypothetical protein